MNKIEIMGGPEITIADAFKNAAQEPLPGNGMWNVAPLPSPPDVDMHVSWKDMRQTRRDEHLTIIRPGFPDIRVGLD